MKQHPSTASRRPYHAPTLRTHGTVAELTLAGGPVAGSSDGMAYGAPAAPDSGTF